MNNKFTVIFLIGDEKRIVGFKQENKDKLAGKNTVNLTRQKNLAEQIEFIIEDETLSKTKDTIVVEITEYYPETIDDIIEDIHKLDVFVKFLMIIDHKNMSTNDQAVYDRISEILDVTDDQVEKASYMTYDQPNQQPQFFRLPNNVITNITNLNQLIDSIRFYYGIEDTNSMADSKIPTDVKNLIESSYNLIASRIVDDIKNINE